MNQMFYVGSSWLWLSMLLQPCLSLFTFAMSKIHLIFYNSIGSIQYLYQEIKGSITPSISIILCSCTYYRHWARNCILTDGGMLLQASCLWVKFPWWSSCLNLYLEFQEKKLVAEIKKTAKTGNEASLNDYWVSASYDGRCNPMMI